MNICDLSIRLTILFAVKGALRLLEATSLFESANGSMVGATPAGLIFRWTTSISPVG
jgi:hypothetical protein